MQPAAALEVGKRITQYSHAVWQEKNGLPSDMVGAILQTRDGYLWFGTLNGLARFDGVRFTTFDPLNSEAPLLHRIASLYEARDGVLWVGARGGLIRHRGGHFDSYPFPEEFRTSVVRTILEDGAGQLWVRTQSDLFLLKNGRLEFVAPGVRSISVPESGGLRVATAGGIGRLEDGRVLLDRVAPEVVGESRPFSVLSEVVEEQDGTTWLGAPWGLGRLGPGGDWTVFTNQNGLPSTAVTCLRLDRQGTLWVGTTRGLARFSRGGRTPVPSGDPLRDQRIQAIYEDHEGSLWIGTDTDGVHQLRDGLFTAMTTQDGLSDDLAMPIIETRDAAIWIGTARGLNRLRAGRIETYTTRDGLSDDRVFALAEGADGRLWVGTSKGPLHYFDGRRLHAFSAPGLPSQLGRVTAILGSRDGSLWVGTNGGGLYRVQRGATTHYTRETGLSSNSVSRLHERPDGSVWVATDQGITRFDAGRATVYGTSDGLPSPQVRAFHEAGESLWIGTYGGGLCRLRGGRFEPLPAAAGLPDTVIYAILQDDRRDLWMTSNRGIIRVGLDVLERLAAGRKEASPFTLYDIGDGLKTRTCVGSAQPAGWRSRDGRLWFPTRRGAVWVDPARPPVPRPHSTPLIERVLLDERAHAPGKLAVALPGRGNLAIDYTAPNFRSPSALRFRYRLDGFDADWVEAGGRRTAQYTNVPPGRYTFRVAVVAQDGTAGSGEASAEVEFEPHFYQTAWFYAACLAAGAFLAWALYRAKLREVRGRFAAVLAERNRIAREMHDALDQGFAALSLQLDLCSKMAADGSERTGGLKQRLELTRNLLEYARSESKRSISDLRSAALEAGDLVSALSKVADQFKGSDFRIDLSVEGRARRLPGAVENNLLRICQEAVTNALHHGQARQVAIGLAFARESVSLEVTDTGHGFDVQTAASEREGHFGLMGMRERAKKLGGRLRLDSQPGLGTKVLVEVPVSE